MTTRISRRAIACALLASTAALGIAAQPSHAQQTTLVSFPAEKFAIAPGGVDMRTGRYAYSVTDLSIGPSKGGLELNHIMPDYAGQHGNPFANFSHNWDIWLLERPPESGMTTPEYRLVIHMGGRGYSFEGPPNTAGAAYKSDGPVAYLTGSTSTKSSASIYYTAQLPDGTIITFRPMGNSDCASQLWGSTIRRCAYASSMIEPDGTNYTFTYASTGSSSGNAVRLTQVVSNRGYGLLLEGTGTRVTKACVLNLTTTTMPTSGLCPTGVPTTSYSYSSDYAYSGGAKLLSFTDPTGAVSQYTYSQTSDPTYGVLTSMGFIKPGQPSAWVTNTYWLNGDEEQTAQEVVLSQTFADGRSYSYNYNTAPVTANSPYPSIVGGTVTDQAGHTVKYQYDWPIAPGSRSTACTSGPPCEVDSPDSYQYWTYQQTPGPVLLEDELGRQTSADYCHYIADANGDNCDVRALQSYTDPEGIKTDLQYDNYGNVSQSTRNPKPGSGLAPIVLQAAYATSNIKTQTKPLWIKDGNGNQTDYTYDPNHGGVLTETKPAVNGIRPQTRYTYSQRYAWIKNTSGTYSQAATPVWLLTAESFCKTSSWNGTACTAANDEVVTTYDYGPNSGPNNLSLRGRLVTADGVSRRTCFAYDAQGNRISETKPRAGLSSCP